MGWSYLGKYENKQRHGSFITSYLFHNIFAFTSAKSPSTSIFTKLDSMDNNHLMVGI